MSGANSKIANGDKLIWNAMTRDRKGLRTLIVCFFTGVQFPKYVAPMERQPSVATGIPFNETFFELYRDAISLNPAVHDGAVLVGRTAGRAKYKIVGWSYRLFPPEVEFGAPKNKGSAYHSSLAMSAVESVDWVHLLSKNQLTRFRKGRVVKA